MRKIAELPPQDRQGGRNESAMLRGRAGKTGGLESPGIPGKGSPVERRWEQKSSTSVLL